MSNRLLGLLGCGTVFLCSLQERAEALPHDSLAQIRSVAPAKRPLRVQTSPKKESASTQSFQTSATPGKRILLPPLDAVTLQKIEQQDAQGAERRVRIGIGRALTSVLTVGTNAPAGEWTQLGDGARLWVGEITSAGAEGLRLHLQGIHLPADASIRVYSALNPAEAGTFITPESLGLASAGGAGRAATSGPSQPRVEALGGDREGHYLETRESSTEDIWTPTCAGETAIVQCYLPSNAPTSAVSFEISELSHIYRGLKADGQPDVSCIPQVACYADWLDTGSGVALMQFVDTRETYLCTGCLLNDADPSTFTDYFLTAHHCIPNATVAATLELFWLYQADTCGGAPALPGDVPHTTGGATLLATSKKTDFAFLQLRQPAPDTATFLGWTTALPTPTDSLTCVQHPGGADTRISFGQLADSDLTDWYLLWTTGVTEEGSSGSPLLNSEQLVIGQLEGGLSTCSNPEGIDAFGRFDLTYKSISHWIDNGPFISKKGIYNGLFSDTNQVAHESSGYISIKLTDRGAYSGMLLCAGARYSLSGKFNADGTASKVVTGRGPSLTVNLAFDLSPGGSDLVGTVSSGAWTAEILALPAPFNAKTNAAPAQGTYTVVFSPEGDNPLPPGYGFGTAKIDGSGKIKFSGSLADGTSASQSTVLTLGQAWPLYLSPYKGKGSALGWLTFGSEINSDVAGDVSWIKKPQTAKYYASGFTNALGAVGFKYTRPASGTSAFGAGTGIFTAEDGSLSGSYTSAVMIATSGKITSAAANAVKLSTSAGTGIVTGKFSPSAVTRPYSARGVVLQRLNSAYGYFLGTNQTGTISITTP